MQKYNIIYFKCNLTYQRETQLLVEEIFKHSSMDKQIDLICVEFSEKLIDDMPSHDPRWAESNPKGKSFSSNLIISNQLKGKTRFHEYFLTFLKQFQIWPKVSTLDRIVLLHLIHLST